jgi:ribosomal protein S27AE
MSDLSFQMCIGCGQPQYACECRCIECGRDLSAEERAAGKRECFECSGEKLLPEQHKCPDCGGRLISLHGVAIRCTRCNYLLQGG